MKIIVEDQAKRRKPITISDTNLNQWKIDNLEEIKLNDREKEAFYLIQGILKLESILKYREYGRDQIKFSEPIVRIEMDYLNGDSVNKVEAILQNLFWFSDRVDVPFKVTTNSKTYEKTEHKVVNRKGKVCLFSGGVDSTAGIVETSRGNAGSPIYGLYVSYNTAGGAVKKVADKLMDWKLPGLKGIYTLKIRKGGGKKVQQVRGFVFTGLGILFASKLGLSSVIISEVGPVMYQPFFNVLDDVTITTHPFTISLSRQLMNLLIGERIDIEIPFSDKTKAEIVHDFLRHSPKGIYELSEVLKLTRSCRHTMWINHPHHPHCGYCLGCVIRRSAFLLNGIMEENTQDYEYDVWGIRIQEENEKYNKKTLENVAPLIEFSKKILENEEDKEQLPLGYEKIQEYGKQKLYRRYAMEILSTLYLIYEEKKIGQNPVLKDLYSSLRQSNKIDLNIIRSKALEFSKVNGEIG